MLTLDELKEQRATIVQQVTTIAAVINQDNGFGVEANKQYETLLQDLSTLSATITVRALANKLVGQKIVSYQEGIATLEDGTQFRLEVIE